MFNIPDSVFSFRRIRRSRSSGLRSRPLGQIVTILDALAKAGVIFVALKENIRVEGKPDIQTKVMTTLFALFAEVERDLILARWAPAYWRHAARRRVDERSSTQSVPAASNSAAVRSCSRRTSGSANSSFGRRVTSVSCGGCSLQPPVRMGARLDPSYQFGVEAPALHDEAAMLQFPLEHGFRDIVQQFPAPLWGEAGPVRRPSQKFSPME